MRFLVLAALLLGAGPALAQPYAYVPNSGSNDVSVIDTATNTVTATIPVGTTPWGVAVAPDGSRAYIPNRGSNNVSVIDTATNTVTATVPVGADPYAAAISPDGGTLYVPNYNGGTVSVIDTATNAVTATVAGFSAPWYSAVSLDGSLLYVANRGAGNVLAMDTATNTIVQTFAVGGVPGAVAVLPDGSKMYVTQDSGNPVSVVDLGTNLITTIPTGGSTIGVAISVDSATAYVTNYGNGNVFVIDTATDTISATVGGLNSSIGVAVHPDGNSVYVARRNDNVVSVIDTATNTVSLSIPVGVAPYAIGTFIPVAYVPPIAAGVNLDAPVPVLYAEEIIASPGSPVTLDNASGNINISTPLRYSFSPGEVRYARVECDAGMSFAPGAIVTYLGAGNAALGVINGAGSNAVFFSITANDNAVVSADRLILSGDRRIAGTNPVNCTYGLYDFPSQAQAGGPIGRVATQSGAYLRFGPSYALEVDSQGGGVANVESADPAYSGFVLSTPTNDVLLAQIGGFSYGTVSDVAASPQPRAASGVAINLANLMGANTALNFAGDFDTAFDVFFSPNADCSVNIQSADSFNAAGATFVIGAAATLNHYLCFQVGGDPIRASNFTVALAPVSAAPAVYAVTPRGPLALGVITRNGAQLQAPLAQVPAGYLSRMVLTNTGSAARGYVIEVFGETGNVISTANLTGTVPAAGTLVVDLNSVLTGFTASPRATLNVTVSGPNKQIQGLYQIVNPNSGTVSNHVMVRPGTN